MPEPQEHAPSRIILRQALTPLPMPKLHHGLIAAYMHFFATGQQTLLARDRSGEILGFKGS